MVNDLHRRAKEALAQFKKENALKAIIPKTENQKVQTARWNRSKRIKDVHEARKISSGAASEVRTLKTEDL